MNKDGIYIKEGNKEIFIPSSDKSYQSIKQNIIVNGKQSSIKQLIRQILIFKRWEKYKSLDKIIEEIYNNIILFIKNDNDLNKCIKTLEQLNNNENILDFNNLLYKQTLNIYEQLDSSNFFKNEELLKRIIEIKENMIGEGEILFTLITNCKKGKIVDLFLNNEQQKIYKQIELKGPGGRIGNEHNVRKYIDKLKTQTNNIFDIKKTDSDTIIFNKILNKIDSLSPKEKINILYNIRTEKCSVLKDYFIEQINVILEEFESIEYNKLMLAIQIYSYCCNMNANYLILMNELDMLIISPSCLWNIYEQLLNTNIKIGYNISDRKGFSVSYLQNK